MFEAPGQDRQDRGALAARPGPLGPQGHRHIGCSNGLAWSPDGKTIYFTDSHAHFVWAWDFDAASGDIANRRVFIDLTAEDYIVDGATVDAEGCYWLTVPFKGKVWPTTRRAS